MPRTIPSIESLRASDDDVDKASSVVPYLADSTGTTNGAAMTSGGLPAVHLPPITLHRGSGLTEDPLLTYSAHAGGKIPLGGHVAASIPKDEREESSAPDDKSTSRPSTAGSNKALMKKTNVGGFGVTSDDLSRLVNFDRREGEPLREQLAMMEQSPFNGLKGIGQRLRTDLHKGLEITKRPTTMGQRSLSSGILVPDETLPSAPILLDVLDAKERREAFGINLVPPPPSDTILEIVWGTIKEDTIIKILIAGAIVTLAVGLATEPEGGWIEGVAILMAVLIVLTVTAGNDYSKDKKFKKLLLLNSDKKTKIVRGGHRDQISSWDVLTGDLVELAIGDEIPADGILVRGNRLVVDESPLTGESLPVKKSEKAPFMFSGCQVSEGSGEMLVTSVGPRSTGGKIQELLSETQKQDTPLQTKLKDVAVLVGKIGFTAGIGTFIALIIQWGIHLGKATTPWEWSNLSALVHFFVIGVTVVVVAVPEGLPLAVTISLAFSMLKMIKDRCFVRHLDASETMGQATCICTDKTGTLTENRMTVVKVMAVSQVYEGEGAGSGRDRIFRADTMDRQIRDLLCESICVNSSCFIKNTGGKVSFIGSPTEGALLVFSEKLGVDYQALRDEIPQLPEGTIGFDSGRKRMLTTVRPKAATPGDVATYRLYVKGASEIVLGLCTRAILTADPYEVRPLNAIDMEEIQNTIKTWAAEGLRTIVTAYRDMNVCGEEEDPDHDLVFVGLLGIKDPVRKEVPHAVAQCQRAGIVVRMVTGDNILTASKIARECHILDNSGIAMEGPVFRAMTELERLAVIPRLQVLARSSPEDKLILVSTLKTMGEVVAVTGDGTNDAPALKEANVGFAMGISGTQIAMNACDIILLDDNFATIVSALRWGRNVLNCVRKFLQFQLAVNLTAIAITFIGSLTTGESPLTAVQLLWVNLIMDTLGALALASDEPDEDILLKAPHGLNEKMITKPMSQYIAAQTVFQVAILLIILYTGDLFIPMDLDVYTTDKLRAQRIETLVFTSFVFLQISNEIMARNLNHQVNMFKGLLRNRLFGMILILILVIQCCIVQFASAFAGTVPLVWPEWVACAIVSLANFVWMFFFRLTIKIYRHHVGARYNRIHATITEKKLEDGTLGAGVGRGDVMKSSTA